MTFLLVTSLLLPAVTGQFSSTPPDSVMWKLEAGFITPDASALGRVQVRRLLSNLLDIAWTDPALIAAGSSITQGAGPVHHSPFRIITSEELSDRGKIDALREQLLDGNRNVLVPLVCFLVELGRVEEAETYMVGMGVDVPATRRDLAVAAAWYGRFDVYPLMVRDLAIPADLEGDSRELQFAAIIALGWINLAPDGLFHGEQILWVPLMDRFIDAYCPGADLSCRHDWVSMREMEAWFETVASGQPSTSGTGAQ